MATTTMFSDYDQIPNNNTDVSVGNTVNISAIANALTIIVNPCHIKLLEIIITNLRPSATSFS